MFFLLIKTIKAAVATPYSPFMRHIKSFHSMGERSVDHTDLEYKLEGILPYSEINEIGEFQQIFKVSTMGVPKLDPQYYNFANFFASKMAEYKLIINYILIPLLTSNDFAEKRDFFKFFGYDDIQVDQLKITSHLQSIHRVTVEYLKEDFNVMNHVKKLFLKLHMHPTLQFRVLHVIQPYVKMMEDLLSVKPLDDDDIFKKFQYHKTGEFMYTTTFLKNVEGYAYVATSEEREN